MHGAIDCMGLCAANGELERRFVAPFVDLSF